MSADKQTSPLVSVLVPAFNHKRFVAQAIQSVLDQTYERVELIVVDDGSHDGTVKVASELASQHRFTFVRNESNLGLNATIEKALALSNGDYVSVLASDDWIGPEKIAEQVALLSEHGWDAVYGTCCVVEGDRTYVVDLGDLEKKFGDGSILDHLYTDSSHAPLLQSALIRRDCFTALCPERRQFTSDDWVMLIRLVERYRVGFVNKPWFYYRQHGANTYRNYWGTLPQRLEVISRVTPERIRARALANVFRDQAQFLYADGKRGMALKFLLASMMLRPSPHSWAGLTGQLSVRLVRRAFRRRPRSHE
jgi:alpha-1,3-rhamnosyltransferase